MWFVTHTHIGMGTGASYKGIYLPGDSQVAASETALWSLNSTPPLTTFDHAINQTLDGASVASQTVVWAGTARMGIANPTRPPGAAEVGWGSSGFSDYQWISAFREASNNSHVMYGISPTLTVTSVPEPSTCASLLAGLACGGYLTLRRRKQA